MSRGVFFWGFDMLGETFRFLIMAALFSLSLVGMAVLLTSCEEAGKLAAYCIKNPTRCD